MKYSVNRKGSNLSGSLCKPLAFHQKRNNLPVYMSAQNKFAATSNESVGGVSSSPRSNSSPNTFHMKTKRVA